jgi:hypothetical protein
MIEDGITPCDFVEEKQRQVQGIKDLGKRIGIERISTRLSRGPQREMPMGEQVKEVDFVSVVERDEVIGNSERKTATRYDPFVVIEKRHRKTRMLKNRQLLFFLHRFFLLCIQSSINRINILTYSLFSLTVDGMRFGFFPGDRTLWARALPLQKSGMRKTPGSL